MTPPTTDPIAVSPETAEQLVAEGFLAKHLRPDGEHEYRLTAQGIEEAREIFARRAGVGRVHSQVQAFLSRLEAQS